VVHFTQLEAAQSAQSLTSLDFCTKEEKQALAKALEGFKFNSPYGPDIKRWLKHGIGLHHAGLLPKYRILVERLAQQGLLKIICGTDTLGVGINVPIRTVLLTKLCKYDGQKTAILSARDFHQITGRAGRKGFDECGWVVAQAPEHVIENMRLEQKRDRDGKKVVKRRPPEKNFVPWDRNTFDRLIAAAPERLVSRFQVSHGMLLNVLARDGDGCAAMRDIIGSCHDSPKQREGHVRRAWQLLRSLTQRSIIEFIPKTETGAKLRVNVELQDDFSMDQSLSLYLLETMALLDKEAADYPLRLLTLVESILEDPDFILRKQLDRLKTQKMNEMKMDGVPFEERIEELDKLEYPKPDREFIYATFNDFSDRHPWVGQENIRPKSIVREMFETFSSFGDYVRSYDLHRAEGLLLRHVNGVYGVIRQTVPDSAKTDAVREMEIYLGAMIRQTDSSLLDEWEKMRDPSYLAPEAKEMRPPGAEEFDRDITRDAKAFTALIRTRIFAFFSSLNKKDFGAALEALEISPLSREGTKETSFSAEISPLSPEGGTQIPSSPVEGSPEITGGKKEWGATGGIEETPGVDGHWTVELLAEALGRFHAEHGSIRLDPEGRNSRHTVVKPSDDKRTWKVQQVIADPEGDNDWCAEFDVDIVKSRERSEVVMRLREFGS
jgi:hypothetical protein